MIVINLYGGAAVGKSTLASNLFVACKKRGFRTELVGEFAKWLHYTHSVDVLADQQYLFAEQLHRLKILRNVDTDIAICDSPLLQSSVYAVPHDTKFDDWILYNYNQFQNVDFLLQRNNDYFFTDKRSETTLAEAMHKDSSIKALLDNYQIPYTTLFVGDDNVDYIMQKVIQ